ncbi:MAG: glycosyltransferase family 39 protein [Desertifilum sp. SIO1I2]|nr:glycosyltransferase family 39 protein [Desertifilum sp. SIO1I2]
MYCDLFKSRELGHQSSRIGTQIDFWFVLFLLVAALFLFGIDLGSLPLRDWDEGIVAQVARNISRSPFDSLSWLYPTLAGEPYLNKPPLIHILIALLYKTVGIHEWTTRLPSAILTALSVPLLYGVGVEIFPKRTPAIFSALIYLTLLPVVRHGRLAMLDGPILCFLLFVFWCNLRSRRNLRYALGTGIGIGLICLTKTILGFLVAGIALLFLFWDTPRLLRSRYLWIGLILGLCPFFFWGITQYRYYGDRFIDTGVMQQAVKRIWQPVEQRGGPVWFYLLELLKYAWPWLLFIVPGYRLVWEHRNASWGKLILVWSGCYFLVVSAMQTKLPWYILPLYPALALVGGVQLTEIWHHFGKSPYLIGRSRLATTLIFGFCFLGGLSCWITFIYLGFLDPFSDWTLPLIFASVAITLTVAAILIAQTDRQFLLILFWGCYVSLLLFCTSDYWVWELQEAYPVKPVAAMIQTYVERDRPIYTSYPYVRPSLDFYSDRHIIPATSKQLQQYWNQTAQPYLLLDRSSLQQLQLPQLNRLESVAEWTLVTRQLPTSP